MWSTSGRRPRPAADPHVRASRVALLASSALHLGFQSTVTTLVYPEVYSVPRREVPAVQERHARTIAPLAAAVYLPVLASAAWAGIATARHPGAPGRLAGILASVGAAIPIVTTASTLPLHVAVASEPTPGRIQGILAADRARTVTAAVTTVAAMRALAAEGGA